MVTRRCLLFMWLILSIGTNVLHAVPSDAGNGSNQNRKFEILSGEVNVTAVYKYPPNAEDEPTSPFDFDIMVSCRNTRFNMSTLIAGAKSLDDAVSQLKRGTGWESDYLLVPYNCGGGNAWRCNSIEVFTILGDQLFHVGSAVSYKNGLFYDYYDHLEVNPLTCHADAPIMSVVMREEGSRFVVDPELTWRENREAYERNTVKIQSATSHRTNDDNDYNPIVPAILFNAALAKYCNRKEELAALLREAEHSLDTQEFKTFARLLSKVNAGAVVRGRRYEIGHWHPGLFNRLVEFGRDEIPFSRTQFPRKQPAPRGVGGTK